MVIERSRVASHSKLKEEIEITNRDMFDVSFPYQKIVICNRQKKKHKTPNSRINEEEEPLIEKILRYRNNNNQDTAQFPKLQQVTLVVHPSSPDAKLRLISAIIVTRNSQNISMLFMLFCTIDTNYNHK